jgi:hypothetical protein
MARQVAHERPVDLDLEEQPKIAQAQASLPRSDCGAGLLQPISVEACLRILQGGQFGCACQRRCQNADMRFVGFFSGELPKSAHVVIGHKSGRWECPHNDTKKTQSVGIHYW